MKNAIRVVRPLGDVSLLGQVYVHDLHTVYAERLGQMVFISVDAEDAHLERMTVSDALLLIEALVVAVRIAQEES